MMRFRSLFGLPLAWGAVFLLAQMLLKATPAEPVFMRTEIELAKAMCLIGSWAAALAFERGDYLRRAWFFIGGCMALLLLRDLTLAPLGFEAMGTRNLEALRGLLVIVANLSQILGTWMLARTWQVAELSLPGSKQKQMMVLAATVVLAIAFTGSALLDNARALAAGDLSATTGFASAVGDIVTLCLIAPLLLTALALQGGLFAWPWTLLTASYTAWLLYDAVLVLGVKVGLDRSTARTISELFRALGCLFGFSAGWAQRRIVQHMSSLKTVPPAS